MDTKTFYAQFTNLGSDISQASRGVKNKGEEFSKLEQKLETKKFMQKVLAGLDNTSVKDPGKYGPAFYFVAQINKNDIERANKPSLYMGCPCCKKDQPVLMKYEQTYDSPEGDTWEKEAFIMCAKDGIHTVISFTREDRFL